MHKIHYVDKPRIGKPRGEGSVTKLEVVWQTYKRWCDKPTTGGATNLEGSVTNLEEVVWQTIRGDSVTNLQF